MKLKIRDQGDETGEKERNRGLKIGFGIERRKKPYESFLVGSNLLFVPRLFLLRYPHSAFRRMPLLVLYSRCQPLESDSHVRLARRTPFSTCSFNTHAGSITTSPYYSTPDHPSCTGNASTKTKKLTCSP